MRPAFLFFLLLLALSDHAQDTIHVQTLTFDSITTRRGWWVFPDSTHSFRKVLMHHTLKCDPATTWDSYDCGEWDYLTYNFIHEHTGALDSNATQHPFFKVGNAAPDTAREDPGVPWDLYQRWQDTAIVLQVGTETFATVGTYDVLEGGTLGGNAPTARSQYLFTAAELIAAGLSPAPINQLALTQVTGGGFTARATIRMKSTTSGSLATFEETGLTTIYDGACTFSLGTLLFTFNQPFNWDGSSNLIVDIAAGPIPPLYGAALQASNVGPGMAVQERGRDGYLEIKDDFVAVDPAPLATLDSAITITFRAFGAPEIPLNNSILEAYDAQDRRLLNVHLPWSDGRVYWDAGNDGGGYDRIDKASVASEVEGQWNNWAFVKNIATGSMKIYLNGALWHSGTGKIKPLSGITRMRFGADANGNIPYPGLIDEVNIFRTEVDAGTIAAWNDRKVTALHPDHAELIHRYGFDEQGDVALATNAVDANAPAWLMGTVQRDQLPATELYHGAGPILLRPVMTFVQGDHVISIDSALVSSTRYHPLISIEHFAVSGNAAVPLDTVFQVSAGWNYTFDPGGNAIDSVFDGGTLHINDTLDYFAPPFEVVDNWEIGRYITPYGIGLTLGPNGFRWTYDVTDYQYLLHDSVELSAGNTQELIDLEFEMIEGAPPREIVRHQRPWGPMGSYSYANLSNDVSLAPVTVDLDPAATQWTVRSRFTGHGHNSNDGNYPHCCEWKDNTHYLSVNGVPADDWHIFQYNDCADNPVYPQGGTWPGAREGWCPGDVVKDHWTDITSLVAGTSAILDYSITPVPLGNLGMGGGNYVVNMDLYEYGPASHQLDAEIYEVKRPTDWEYRGRTNPICHEPVVVLRNAGALDLTSVTFTYGVSGGPQETHTWTGLLKHMESADVTLPVPTGAFWTGDSLHLFTATVSAPNGGADEHAQNDQYTTHFELPVIYTDPVKVFYKTNNRPWENELVIRDMYGTPVYQKDWGTLTANTTYTDTLALTPGCYTLEMLDTGNDGLSYWADPGQGSGFLRLRKVSGGTLKNFISEFGHSLHWSFALNDIVGVEEMEQDIDLGVVPNPTDGRFTLTTSGLEGTATIEVFGNTGSMVLTARAELTGTSRIPIDLGGLDDGLYLVRLICEDHAGTLRVVKQ